MGVEKCALAFLAAIAFCGLTAGKASADPVQWRVEDGGNDHWYDVLVDLGISSWDQASAAAMSTSHAGRFGHLVTITSPGEQGFVETFLPVAGYDEHYWTGGIQAPGSPEPAGGWGWITGEPWSYQNWSPIEPNNVGGANEDRIVLDAVHGWRWTDNVNARAKNKGYVVEYDEYGVPVPEPATLVLCVAAAGLLLLWRRSKGQVRA